MHDCVSSKNRKRAEAGKYLEMMMRMPALGTIFLGGTSSRHFSWNQPLSFPYNSRGLIGNVPKAVKASYNESYQSHGFSSTQDHSAVGQPGVSRGQPSKVYVGHSIFKGKAALTMQPKGPEFTVLDSGGLKLSKEGCVFFEFAPAVGTRQYDWSKKQVFALSVLELGTLLSLGPNESCEFFHDPFMGKSEAGNVRKVLKVDPLPDRPGYFFNLSVSNRILNVDEHLHIPITKAEFAVMQSAFNFILPYLMGWHVFANSAKPDDSSRFMSDNSGIRESSDLEWDAPF
eukprot:Gb_40890 [translate_table: standard]